MESAYFCLTNLRELEAMSTEFSVPSVPRVSVIIAGNCSGPVSYNVHVYQHEGGVGVKKEIKE